MDDGQNPMGGDTNQPTGGDQPTTEPTTPAEPTTPGAEMPAGDQGGDMGGDQHPQG